MAIKQSSRDGNDFSGYQLLCLGSIIVAQGSYLINKVGQEFKVTYSGLNFNVGTGMLIDQGLIVENDTAITNIPLTTGGVSGTKYLVIENNRNTGISTAKIVDSLTNTNFVENPQGTSHFLLATINHSANSITGVEEAKKLFDTEWINLTLRSGFTAPSEAIPQARRIGNVVYLRGRIQFTMVSGTEYRPLSLPVDVRPRLEVRTSTGGTGMRGYGNIVVLPGGDIILGFHNGGTSLSAPTWLSIGISYLVD